MSANSWRGSSVEDQPPNCSPGGDDRPHRGGSGGDSLGKSTAVTQLDGCWRCEYCGEVVPGIPPDGSPSARILARPAGANTRLVENSCMLIHRCAMQSAWIPQ